MLYLIYMENEIRPIINKNIIIKSHVNDKRMFRATTCVQGVRAYCNKLE